MLNQNAQDSIRLDEIADQAMLERGFLPEFPLEVLREVDQLKTPNPSPTRDMRGILWVSIDNDDSLDLDHLTYAEKPLNGKERIYVAIAEVNGLVEHNSAIDLYAAHNTTSVYTPTKNYPMLHPKLSTNLTSLNENAERSAIVVAMEIGSDGSFELSDIYPARVLNHAKLSYNKVLGALEKNLALHSTEVLAQVKLQDVLAQRIQNFRDQQGSLTFAKLEVRPIIRDGVAVALEPAFHNRAHQLIENFMIAANVGMTRFLEAHQQPTLRRVVQTPERWDRIVAVARELNEKLPDAPDVKALHQFLLKRRLVDPEHFPDLSLTIIKLIGKGEYVVGVPGKPTPGHFDLALRQYAHSTAPNRRYPDLIMQRLLKGCFGHPLPYTIEELDAIAKNCTQKEDDANKVERRMQKSAAAMVLKSQIGQQFSAMVTGVTPQGTWVRLLNPPIEGRLMQGYQNVDVGHRITVQLIHADVLNGHIDFIRI